MAELAALARPYAEAVFLAADEKGQVDKWADTLEFLKQVVSNDLVKKLTDNPKISKQALEDAMLDICGDQMDDQGLNLVKLLIKSNRLALIDEISAQYEVKKAEKSGELDVVITSAFPMSASGEKEIVKSLSSSFGKKVKISVEEDSSLIGGMIIRVGDKVIDGSLSGQIQQLAKQLK
jgi:F-type H+-transporting ATPase subunit delta